MKHPSKPRHRAAGLVQDVLLGALLAAVIALLVLFGEETGAFIYAMF
ncbi:MAG: hypothetical protein JRI55_02840 [Deltaproteobacteria bacterium]|nr:hypothetical protein [Deltaproteobacteria bacterium]